MKFFLILTVSAFLAQTLACDSNCELISNNNTTVLSRAKRYLDFMKATRMFFRVNIRENVFTTGILWAHASGFKANMNILNDNKGLRPYRRDTYQVLQELFDLHGLDGQTCMLKAFCTATRTSDGSMANGILFKLLRHVFTLKENDRNHFTYLKEEQCDQIIHHRCPLSFNGISRFTDDV